MTPPSSGDRSAPASLAADEPWDVVVVGAGPAGASAALAAAGRGARTLLLDRADFPRYKTCGGGLIGVSASLIDHVEDLPVREAVDTVSFTLRGRHHRRRRASSPFMLMVRREDLDQHLVSQAVARGALFVGSTRVTALDQAGADLVAVRTTRGVVHATTVIGADGSSGRVARFVGVTYALTDLGLEVELAAADQAARWAGRAHLDWGPLPGSYGWVFPKGDVLTVGVIAERGRPEETRAYLNALLRDLGLERLVRLRDTGHLTRCRSPHSPLRRGSVLVAGDAAGLLEPLTREGISFALRSGSWAGHRAAEYSAGDGSALARYDGDVARSLAPEMAAGLLSRQAFSRRPWVFHLLIGWTRTGWSSFVRITGGETTLASGVSHRRARLPLMMLRGRARSGAG